MKLSWHFQVMGECLVGVYRNFSFSSRAARISLKAAAATCLSIYIALALNFQDPFFAGFGCFLMLLPNSGAVLARAGQSLKGALFGGVLGYLLLGLTVNDHFAFSIVIFITTSFFCYVMSVRKRTSFFWYYALVNLLLAALAGAVDPANALDAAFFRVVNVSLGIICYVLVAVVLFPDLAESTFLASLEQAHKRLYLCASDILGEYLSSKYDVDGTYAKIDEVEKAVSELESRLDDLKEEERILGRSRIQYEASLLHLERVKNVLVEFYELASDAKKGGSSFQKNFPEFLKKAIEAIQSASDFKYGDEDSLGRKLAALLEGFASGKDKETYFQMADRYDTEDILLLLECLYLCKVMSESGHDADNRGRGEPGKNNIDEEDGDDCVDFSFFGRKLFSLNLMLARFSVKTALAVIADFWVFFWFEIPGSPATIAISALTVIRPDVILSRHRIILRLTGCLAGVACAFIFLAFGVQTTIVMFAYLFIMAFVCGLVWLDDAGIAYFGFQALLAYMFAVIPDLTPAADVTEPVQRAVGIGLGVLVAWIVMLVIFPEDIVRAFRARFVKRMELLRADLFSVSNLFKSHSFDEAAAVSNFALENYNALFARLLVIGGHKEMEEREIVNARLFITGCIRIHRQLGRILPVEKEIAEYMQSVDPDLASSLLVFVADLLCFENSLTESDLEGRLAKLSERLIAFEKIQRDKKLIYDKGMDFKVAVAHILLSFTRMLDYSGSLILIRSNLPLSKFIFPAQ